MLIDATIIRGVLLPASMKLLGDWNWYLPKWLEWMPEITHEPTSRGSGARARGRGVAGADPGVRPVLG